MVELSKIENDIKELAVKGVFTAILERAEEIAKDTTPDMDTVDIILRAYIQAVVDLSVGNTAHNLKIIREVKANA